MKNNNFNSLKMGLLKIIILIVLSGFVSYHVAYQIGKYSAHIENEK